MGMPHQQRIEALTEIARETVATLGIELVDLELRGSSRHRTLVVFIDRPGAAGVNHDDCKAVTDALGDRLEEADDLLPESYVMEVSSPGIDRPIRTPDDVRRNVGRDVAVRTREPIGGETEFRGRLVSGDGGRMRITRSATDDTVEIPLAIVESARQDVGF